MRAGAELQRVEERPRHAVDGPGTAGGSARPEQAVEHEAGGERAQALGRRPVGIEAHHAHRHVGGFLADRAEEDVVEGKVIAAGLGILVYDTNGDGRSAAGIPELEELVPLAIGSGKRERVAQQVTVDGYLQNGRGGGNHRSGPEAESVVGIGRHHYILAPYVLVGRAGAVYHQHIAAAAAGFRAVGKIVVGKVGIGGHGKGALKGQQAKWAAGAGHIVAAEAGEAGVEISVGDQVCPFQPGDG